MSFTSPSHDRYQRRCAAVVLVVVMGLLLALGGRLVQINTSMRPQLIAQANRQQRSRSSIPARRGTIFDVRGRVAAATRRMPTVFVDPTHVDDVKSLARELAVRIDGAPSRIMEQIERHRDGRFVPIARRVDEATADAIRSMRHPAVGLLGEPVRTHPLGTSMTHVLGLVGRDGAGLEGIELAFDEHLTGKQGWRAAIRDARRRPLWRTTQSDQPPVDGGDVVLTLDAEIQRIAEEQLAATVARCEARSGVVIVMSPRSGEVIAMACAPPVDPEHVMPDSQALRRNRAITDPVEPGSTFKLIAAAGALEGGFISLTEEIDCHMGRYRIGRRTITDVSPSGLLNLRGIITRSSNIGMAQIGQRMGNEALHEVIRRFGFGARLGIELPGENAGIVHPLGNWTDLSTASVTFGYEVAVTPLQLLSAFCAIANDGVLLRPRVVRALLGPDGRTVASFETPEIVRRVVSSAVAREMVGMLESVVENGGGHRAQLNHYRVMGKTGTAKLTLADRPGYETGAYLSSFVGIAPASDPALAVLVMVRRPNPALGYYGGIVSAPAVRAILDASLAYLDVPPDKVSGVAGL